MLKDFKGFFCDRPSVMMPLRKEMAMSMQKILDRQSQMPNEPPGTTVVPSPELLALFVRWCRRLMQWKVSTLAEFASVSVSTIERIERGEKVNGASLEQVAAALGYAPGTFTPPRKRACSEEAYASMAEQFGHLETVNVRPFKQQGQVRVLSECCAILLITPAWMKGWSRIYPA
jgi:transcriptional regulator with XRE-family HTH domain